MNEITDNLERIKERIAAACKRAGRLDCDRMQPIITERSNSWS